MARKFQDFGKGVWQNLDQPFQLIIEAIVDAIVLFYKALSYILQIWKS